MDFRDYGVIFNWDGAPLGHCEVPESRAAFLEKAYAPMEDTQVGAHFWCVGAHAATWPTGVLELVGDDSGRRYESAMAYRNCENLRRMLERGEDSNQAVIDRGRELGLHVYASVRMNDNHFNGMQVADLLDPTHKRRYGMEMTSLRREHPEWLLGDRTSEWFALSWNFAEPEVRKHRFAYVEEVCERYDWDGVELDWQRHGFYFPTDDAYRLRHLLTDLQRAIRQMAQRIAERRGRPFYVAARVSGHLESNFRIGFDVPRWVEEGLLDVLIPAGGAATDPSIDVSTFVEMCRGKDIAVYPGFDGGLPYANPELEGSTEWNAGRVRAIASCYYKQGATGIYTFNWHATPDSHRELLQQIGSPQTMQNLTKIYAAPPRVVINEGEWRGAYHNDRIWGEVPVALNLTLTGDGPSVVLEVVDDVPAAAAEGKLDRVELRIRLLDWTDRDRVEVYLDGAAVANPAVRYPKGEDPNLPTDVDQEVWLVFPLSPGQVTAGRHEVKVVLQERNPHLACDLVLTDVELLVAYRPTSQ